MKHFVKSLSFFVFFISVSFSGKAQAFMNGSFEITTAGSDQINISNAAFNSLMANTVAYGSFGDMDIVQSATYCGLAQSGLWYTALTGSATDAFTMQLTAPLVAGTSYTITFYDRGCFPTFSSSAPPVQLGVSTTAGSVGTPVGIASAPVNGTWTMKTMTFVAPVSGAFISVELSGGGLGDWTQVDNFAFTTTTTAPVANFSASQTTICAGSCISFTDLSTGAPTSWSWSFPGGTPATSTTQNPPSVCYSTAGTYNVTLTATNAGGSNTFTQTGYITVNPQQSAAFSYSPSTFCVGGADPSPTITGTPGGTFSSTAGLSINASSGLISLSGSTTGTYVVTYMTAGPCPDTATQTVNLVTSPTANFSYAGPYCSNGTDPLPTIAPGSSAGTFTSTPGLSINASTGLVDLSASTAGTYTVTNTIAASGSCPAVSSTATIVINAVPVPTITGNGSICGGSNSILTAAGGTTYTWNTGATTASVTVTPAVTTTYTVTASNSGCTATATFTVAVTTPGVAGFSYAGPYCQNASDPTPTFTGAPGTFSSTAGLVFVSTSTGQVDLSASTPGTYTVTNTLPASGPCPPVTATANITIVALPVPVITGTTNICSGASTTLTASGGSTYTWSTGSGLATTTVSPATTTTYTVTANNSGCTATTTQTVTVSPPPVGSTTGVICAGQVYTFPSGATTSTAGTYSDTISTAGGCDSIVVTSVSVLAANANASPDVTIQFGNTTNLNSTGGVSYSWAPGATLSCTTCNNPTASPLETTTYTVTVTNANGCTATDVVTVNVDMPPCDGALVDLEVLVPNAFSPNDDGVNDQLCVPANPCIKELNITIFDRWGEKVYEGNKDDCWDGKFRGKKLESAVFVYFFTVKFENGNKGSAKGNISLIR